MSAFVVRTEVFDGPLDLLLQLVEKRKLFINDISLAEVTDEYIEYVKRLEDFPIPDAAQFVLIASTLLLIKSKSLLPVLELTEDEEEDIADLERRLVLYKRMREMSVHVRKQFSLTQQLVGRDVRVHTEPLFVPTKDTTLDHLRAAAQQLITSLPKATTLSKAVVTKVMSLDDMIGRLTDRIKTGIQTSFKAFAGSHDHAHDTKEAKVHVVVSFLAMLELVKTGTLLVTQHDTFDDITIHAHSDQ